jgi:ribosomal-protein-alanine N-acetyltransferase
MESSLLTTARLELRPVRMEDVGGLWPLVSDARLTPFLAWEPHQSKNETEQMVSALMAAQQVGKGFHWTVFHGGCVVGLVSLIDVRRTHRSWILDRAELAYWIGPDNHGRGFATEASKAAVQCGFRVLGLHKIIVYHAADNPSSGEVVRKLGFRFVGNEREAFCKNGRWHDLQQYEMLSSEFKLSEKSSS